MRGANGQTTACPKETTDVESFAFVSTWETTLNEGCVLENMREQINEFVTKKEEVVHQLNTLGIQNAAGTDAIHPLIVKTLAETDNSVNIVIISSRSRNLLMASQSILSLQ